ncbi:hypothetical protein TSAR_000672 [Trichomalopsis sarcophagae]|uniref:Uncharacterized protein n=1 Tax=Trichomalopsis sarcophagae TaxID=543379 RepID=A0A232EXR3_9HYME|nr:hypothetical protein TSAR_000672 [Trichomalopsis sarcophagae]
MYPLDCVKFKIIPGSGFYLQEFPAVSDPYEDESIRNDDLALHRELTESKQINELLRSSKQDSQIKLLLEQRPVLKLIFLNDYEIPPLWVAVACCYQKTAELLVCSGAEVNERNVKISPVHAAIESILHLMLQLYPSSWNDRLVGLLLEHAADFQFRDSRGETLLHRAVCYQRIQVIRLLLQRGADPNVAGSDGRTPLLLAVKCREADKVVALLLRYGVEVTATDSQGRNALHHLASSLVERVELARVLIERGVSLVHKERLNQYQPLHEAAAWGNIGLINLFLDYGADVNALADDDVFPLFLAALQYHGEKNTEEVMLSLLKRGANIDLKTMRNCTTLHAACLNATVKDKTVKFLMYAGVDVFAIDDLGLTAFTVNIDEDIRLRLLRFLAMMKARQSLPDLKDRADIFTCPKMSKHYEDCCIYIAIAKSTDIINGCTFFDLLTKCQCQIASLMRNPDFQIQFRRHDLATFSMYAVDMLEAFERALRHYEAIVEQEEHIDEAFYSTLSHILVSKMARYVCYCEVCELRKIASRAFYFYKYTEAYLHPNHSEQGTPRLRKVIFAVVRMISNDELKITINNRTFNIEKVAYRVEPLSEANREDNGQSFHGEVHEQLTLNSYSGELTLEAK